MQTCVYEIDVFSVLRSGKGSPDHSKERPPLFPQTIKSSCKFPDEFFCHETHECSLLAILKTMVLQKIEPKCESFHFGEKKVLQNTNDHREQFLVALPKHS